MGDGGTLILCYVMLCIVHACRVIHAMTSVARSAGSTPNWASFGSELRANFTSCGLRDFGLVLKLPRFLGGLRKRRYFGLVLIFLLVFLLFFKYF